jgi:hypothetical protein
VAAQTATPPGLQGSVSDDDEGYEQDHSESNERDHQHLRGEVKRYGDCLMLRVRPDWK